MMLLVGIGNPGARHARNRHNVGFMILDEIMARHSFAQPRSKFDAAIAEGRLGSEKTLAIKPETYVNESGRAVGAAMRFYKLEADDVMVIHDEIDLAPNKVRVKYGGGVAGHNGLRSIAAHIGPDFWRVRIGVGHPGHKDRVHGHVLGDFAKSDEEWLVKMIDAVADAAPLLGDGDPPAFMSKVAQVVSPPRPNADPAQKPPSEKGRT
jgi:PTH1 family peptidyl-tRNA hydrolase